MKTLAAVAGLLISHNLEHRTGVQFRVSGRTLSGVAIQYGDIAPEHRERFDSGAFGIVSAPALNLQHDPDMVILEAGAYALTDSPRALTVRADLPESSAALKLVRRGALTGFSVEFRSHTERMEAGIRVIERAELTGLALVDHGAYPGSTARYAPVVKRSLPTCQRAGWRANV